MKFENEIIEKRWNYIEKSNKQKEKILIGVITSDSNSHCQSRWIGKTLFLGSYYDMVIFENSDTEDNFKKLKELSHNLPNLIVKRGATHFKTVLEKITANRNLVLKYIRKYTGYTHILMIDSDIFPSYDMIKSLLSLKKEIACALCYVTTNGIDKRPALNFFKEDIDNGNAERWINTRKPRVVKVHQNGLGCVLFKADILRKHKDIKFYNKKSKKDGKLFLNEDLTFTDNFRQRGYDLCLDLRTECEHMIKGRFLGK